MIKTFDNFFSDLSSSKNNFIDNRDLKRIGKGIDINLSEYLKFKNNKVLSFLKIEKLQEKQSENEVIISIKKDLTGNPSFITRTGNYVGKFLDDSQFDAGAFSFVLGAGQVVVGFDEGIGKMKIGEKATLIFPSSIGYGDTAKGSIPANSPLLFTIQVTSAK